MGTIGPFIIYCFLLITIGWLKKTFLLIISREVFIMNFKDEVKTIRFNFTF